MSYPALAGSQGGGSRRRTPDLARGGGRRPAGGAAGSGRELQRRDLAAGGGERRLSRLTTRQHMQSRRRFAVGTAAWRRSMDGVARVRRLFHVLLEFFDVVAHRS